MEAGPHVTVLPHTGTNAPCPGGGAELGASATRSRSGKLGHSSAPLVPHSSSGKSTQLSLLSWLEGPIEQWLPQWQMGNRTAGSWEHDVPHGTPSSELKYSNYWRQDFRGNGAFLLYRAEQPCTLRGYLQGMCSKIACLFHNSSEERRGYLYHVPG